jgi:hypothetical protein
MKLVLFCLLGLAGVAVSDYVVADLGSSGTELVWMHGGVPHPCGSKRDYEFAASGEHGEKTSQASKMHSHFVGGDALEKSVTWAKQMIKYCCSDVDGSWIKEKKNSKVASMANSAECHAQVKAVDHYWFATAGLREIEDAKGNIAAIKTHFETATINGQPNPDALANGKKFHINVIAGMVEGLWGFLANTAGEHAVYIEQGGSSGQVSFECPKAVCTESPDSFVTTLLEKSSVSMLKKKLTKRITRTADNFSSFMELNEAVQSKTQGYVKVEGKCYYSTSFMGFGSNALLGYLLVSDVPHKLDCLPPGFEVQKQAGPNDFKGSGTGAGDCADETPPFMDEMHIALVAPHRSALQNVPGTTPTYKGTDLASPNDAKCATRVRSCATAIKKLVETGMDFRGAVTFKFQKRVDTIMAAKIKCSAGMAKTHAVSNKAGEVAGGAAGWDALFPEDVCAPMPAKVTAPGARPACFKSNSIIEAASGLAFSEIFMGTANPQAKKGGKDWTVAFKDFKTKSFGTTSTAKPFGAQFDYHFTKNGDTKNSEGKFTDIEGKFTNVVSQ